ncbi:hypothetical protein LGK97_05525 [Clostridium sp. CS001]|nr:hypothetical protein [Clostridium sp. CS001]MCB2289223.1 hypothetical protein [Clostridium sp. CS001]
MDKINKLIKFSLNSLFNDTYLNLKRASAYGCFPEPPQILKLGLNNI